METCEGVPNIAQSRRVPKSRSASGTYLRSARWCHGWSRLPSGAMRPSALVVVLVVALVSPAVAQRRVRAANISEFRAALTGAGPGTLIELAPGTYAGGLHHANLRGSDASPVVIRSADGARPAVFTGQIQLSDPSNVVLEGFAIRGVRGNGLNIDDGGSFDSPARHVVMRGLVIEDIGPRGNLDSIKLSGVDDFLVEDCVIRRWGDRGGSGIDMVGCHRGLIEGCVFEHSGDLPASGVQAKGGSSEIAVRGCLFKNATQRAVNIGGSTGEPYYRPQGAKYDSRQVIVIGNRFIGSMAPVAFVGTEKSQVLYNTISRPDKWIVRILQEKPVPPYIPCRDNTFSRNLVVWEAVKVGAHVNIGPNTKPDTFTFDSNLWYAAGAPQRSRPNLPTPDRNGRVGADPKIDPRDAELGATPALRQEYGHLAAGEKEAWEKVAKPLVPWAAGRRKGK